MDRSSSATRAYGLTMKRISETSIAAFVLLFAVQINGSPFSKFGRTCQDIGCRSSEVCKIVEEPCTYNSRDQCGRYPTCVKNENFKASCTTKICGGGQECRTENGEPVCVNRPDILGYDSAGVSSVNGQRTSHNNNNNNNNHDSVSTNTNPYANANAPPPVDEPGRNYPVSAGTNLGYPPYPSSSNSNNNGNSGYPSSSGTNLGYPPYPTQNRMPMPGQGGIYQQQPPQAGGYYPSNSASGYPSYPPNQQYPGHSNYPYQTRNYNSNAHFPRSRGGATSTRVASFAQGNNIVILAGLVLAFVTKYLS